MIAPEGGIAMACVVVMSVLDGQSPIVPAQAEQEFKIVRVVDNTATGLYWSKVIHKHTVSVQDEPDNNEISVVVKARVQCLDVDGDVTHKISVSFRYQVTVDLSVDSSPITRGFATGLWMPASPKHPQRQSEAES